MDLNRRPVIPVAKGDRYGCSFRETKAHARSRTRSQSATENDGLSMVTLGVGLTRHARAAVFKDEGVDAFVVFGTGGTAW
jgi:hypothetical protein